MRVLAIDTAMQACSAAVRVDGENGEIIGEFEARSRGHAEALVPMIERVMGRAGLAYCDLERIAVTSGPGTFTGVRIGVAAARGLSLACKIPIVSLNALQVMARQVMASDRVEAQALIIAVDARRGGLYVQMPQSNIELLAPPEAAARVSALAVRDVMLAGSGGSALKEAAGQGGVNWRLTAQNLQPDARFLAMAAPRLEISKHPLVPLYLRAPDARPQHGKSIARV